MSENRVLLLSFVLAATSLFSLTANALTLDALLEAMPPENAAEAAALFDQVLEGDPRLITALCNRISPDEAGVDAKAQFAIQGLTNHATRPGNTADRIRVARLYEAALNRAGHPDVRRFFMYQLRLCGDDATVAVLAAYVCDSELYDDAVQTIQNIGGPAALLLFDLLHCDELPQAETSIQTALTRMGISIVYTEEETGLSRELIAAAVDPGAMENPERVAGWCRDALQQSDLKPQYRAMVLRTLVRAIGTDALPDLIKALASPDPLCWGMALELADGLPGEEVSRALVFRMPELPDAVHPQMISVLSRRPDRVARTAVEEAISDENFEIRLAVYESIAPRYATTVAGPPPPVGRPSNFGGLLSKAMQKADSAREIQAVKEAMLRLDLLDSTLHGVIREDWDALTAAQQTAYFEIFAERRFTLAWSQRRKAFESEDRSVRRAAMNTAAVVGDESDIELLYGRLLEEPHDPEADAARNAIVALANRLNISRDVVERGGALLAEKGGESGGRLIKTLSDLGGAQALEQVRDAADRALFSDAPDTVLVTAGLDALAVWPAPEATGILLDFLDRLDAEDMRLTVLKQSIVSVQRTLADVEIQRAALESLREHCRNESETQLVAEAVEKTEAEGE